MSTTLSRPFARLRLAPSVFSTRHASSSSSSSSTSSSSQPPPNILPTHSPPSPHRSLPTPSPVLLDGPPPTLTLGGNVADRKEKILSSITGLRSGEIRGLNRYTVKAGRVTQMTKKGKMPSFTALVVVGSPSRGLVGIGRGRGLTNIGAMDAGFQKAVATMDYVNKYEGRTLWGEGRDLVAKWGATKVIMRARPAGFGLMVPPALHRVLTACGIRDASATIEGSRNPVEVVKCAIQILHGGANPPGLGSGLGSRGRREDKGMGMRSKEEIERERGRFGVDIGRRM
ncbi:28S ribosomal protein S5, mitochondrial [Saitozyma podzolica]|uniref:28S ribosomal protein S5, mitochondrial n=1 Tax=Saitozyma podzolica TaxID=1890683 RepID=A0A427YVF2_9TREE|nr:28S ribosomal protein S5, mitochondrial [Saitozyma podzolica]